MCLGFRLFRFQAFCCKNLLRFIVITKANLPPMTFDFWLILMMMMLQTDLFYLQVVDYQHIG
ncbi:MAG: hypothetical protein CMA63_06375 [Euryarchaeota archaeon]|nr:hypothetical protein [Euryarchaeota archaeon]